MSLDVLVKPFCYRWHLSSLILLIRIDSNNICNNIRKVQATFVVILQKDWLMLQLELIGIIINYMDFSLLNNVGSHSPSSLIKYEVLQWENHNQKRRKTYVKRWKVDIYAKKRNTETHGKSIEQ